MIFLQLAVLLICIFIGARLSGIGLGVMGMIGLLILMFVFGLKPSDPPLEVMLIILSVVTAAAALQAAGGMDYLVNIAAKILRSNPGRITFLGPLVTYFFVLFAGTAHISYSIMPIVAEVATKARIRPERAMSMSVTAAHMAITASPVSAATAALLTVLAGEGVQLADILMVCIPSTLIGVLVGILFVLKRGKELGKDPEFLEKMKDPAFAKSMSVEKEESVAPLKPGAKKSVFIFGLAVLSVVLLGSFPALLPDFTITEDFTPSFTVNDSGLVQMPSMIMMIMLAAAGLIILFANTTAAEVTKASLFSSAGSATIAVFGVVWMSATFMDNNYSVIKETLGELVTSYPWSFAIALFVMSILLFSQAATTKALMPLGLALGLSPAYLVGIFPAVNGHFFIPGYPTLLTAIQFDRTGTTKIGKYVLNHSFMLPGLVTTLAAVIAGLLIQSILFIKLKLNAMILKFFNKQTLLIAMLISIASVFGQKTRTEHDLLGPKEIPFDAYYGVQTARALENFQISGVNTNFYPDYVKAYAMVKLAAARANFEVGRMKKDRLDAIEKACKAVMDGKYHDQFLTDLYQGGAGTSANMNANEVLANIGLELSGHKKGEYQYLEPHDDLNMGQSTNDVYPTAIHVAILLHNDKLVREAKALAAAFHKKGDEYSKVLKMGRTEGQDAVPMTVGQEFHGFGHQLDAAIEALVHAESYLYEENMGATAIGTGITASPGYAEKCAVHLAKITGKPMKLSADLVAATSSMQGFVMYSSALKNFAVTLSKISSDLIFLASGPRTGIFEINLPALQPGSSIMPGKVNPVMPELMNQICYKIVGNDATVTIASRDGLLQLNAYEPVVAVAIFESQALLYKTLPIFQTKCIEGITVNEAVLKRYMERSVGTVTALNPILGYEKTTELAKEALETNKGILELIREKKLLTEEQIKDFMDPVKMTSPQ